MSATPSPSESLVLIVDDRADTRNLYFDLIDMEVGCAVETCQSKAEALARLATEPLPGLVLLDVQLPAIDDGLEVCRKIKQGDIRCELQEVPVVMITASDDRDLLRRCLEAGADDFVSRYDPNEEKAVRIRGKLQTHQMLKTLRAVEKKVAGQKAVVEFARGVYHDTGNALQPMFTVAYEVGRVENVDEIDLAELKKNTLDMEESVRHIQRLCTHLRTLCQAEGREDIRPIRVAWFLDEVYGLTHSRSQPSILSIRCDTPAEATMLANEANLLGSWIEMIFNAGDILRSRSKRDKAAPEGLIEIGARILDAERIELWVKDNGPGVPPEDQPLLFEDGFSRREGGTGTGLFLAYERVKAMGGSLEYRDNQPHGAVFAIQLRRGPDESHDE